MQSLPAPEEMLPPLPGEWVVSANSEARLAFLDQATGRSIDIFEVPYPGADGYRVLALAGYSDEDCPRLADHVSLATAIEEAVAEAEAVEAGDPADQSAHVGAPRSRLQAAPTVDDTDEDAEQDQDQDQQRGGQLTLSEWGGQA